MSSEAKFEGVFPFQKDVLALPVKGLDAASRWYCKHFGMTEVGRTDGAVPAVVLERDGKRIGFAVNGGDASQDGAAILVSGLAAMKQELETSGLEIGDCRIDERDGKRFEVFFVVAPDGLCFYFHEPVG